MTSKDPLLEIGCEELPPRSLQQLSRALADNICAELAQQQIPFEDTQVFATPRRLAVIIKAVGAELPPREIERIGPSVKSAYDNNGMPTIACIGFAKSCGVATDQLKIKKNGKGDDRVYYHARQEGLATKDFLIDIVNNAIKKLPISKPMRWGNHNTSFIRPVHWVVLLYGTEIIAGTVLGKTTSGETYGHRFHHPQPFRIPQAKDYSEMLFSRGHVVADFDTRSNIIRKELQKVASTQGEAIISESLLREVTALVEWPVVLKGEFNAKFLDVPREVLITSMQSHQKYFPVVNKTGQLKPCFLFVSNIESKNPDTVIHGNERVINARLADAAFFYANDLKQPLAEHQDQLASMVFTKELGTLADKTTRIRKLATLIAKDINADATIAARAAELCKCDLLTAMVGEFPSLQGIMGYYYALANQEEKACAEAICEHYLPRFANDMLPKSACGQALALADKLDTLVGIIGINKIPTGDKDPFALRRAALGIIRILIHAKLSIDLKKLLQQAEKTYTKLPNTQVVNQAHDFILARLKSWYHDQRISYEVFESVVAKQPSTLQDFDERIRAVVKFQQLPEANALAAANKRVSNILKKQTVNNIPAAANQNLFEHDAERTLANELDKLRQSVNDLYQQADYAAALSELATLKQPIDDFFDHVMVMVEDDETRLNRLALLTSLRQLFTQVADISLLPL